MTVDHGDARFRDVTFRDARDDDSAALVDLITGCWSAYPGCVMDVDGEEPWLRAPATSYAAKDGRVWVAEAALDGAAPAVVGCGALRPAGPGVVELKSMYVAAPARRLGIAGVLVAAVEAEARRRGARRVELWSDTRFVEAHAFYAAQGYERLPGSRDLHDLSATTEWPFAKVLPG